MPMAFFCTELCTDTHTHTSASKLTSKHPHQQAAHFAALVLDGPKQHPMPASVGDSMPTAAAAAAAGDAAAELTGLPFTSLPDASKLLAFFEEALAAQSDGGSEEDAEARLALSSMQAALADLAALPRAHDVIDSPSNILDVAAQLDRVEEQLSQLEASVRGADPSTLAALRSGLAAAAMAELKEADAQAEHLVASSSSGSQDEQQQQQPGAAAAGRVPGAHAQSTGPEKQQPAAVGTSDASGATGGGGGGGGVASSNWRSSPPAE